MYRNAPTTMAASPALSHFHLSEEQGGAFRGTQLCTYCACGNLSSE